MSPRSQLPPTGPRRTPFRAPLRPLFALTSLLALVPGCGSKGGQEAPPPSPQNDAGAMQDLTVAPDLSGPGPLLGTYQDCAAELFASGTKPQDFSSQTALAMAWKTGWAQPQIKGGVLTFGPHPLTADWWENYSPAASLDKPGDVLLCARVRLTAQAGDPVSDNSFELTMRNPDDAMYETSGMALLVEGNASFVGLRTRTGPQDWATYDRKPLALKSGEESTLELLLFGQGSRFVAEVKNVATGQITRLRAEAGLPAGGAVTLLGWRTRSGIQMDKLVLGGPSAAAAAVLLPAVTP